MRIHISAYHLHNIKKGGHQAMLSIEFFAWTLSAILGIGFIISLIAVSRKPKNMTEMERQRPEPKNTEP